MYEEVFDMEEKSSLSLINAPNDKRELQEFPFAKQDYFVRNYVIL